MTRTAAAWLLWPGLLAGSLFAFGQALAYGYNLALALFALTVVNLVLIAGLELVMPARGDWSWLGDRQAINDIGHGIALQLGAQLGRATLAILLVQFAYPITGVAGLGLWPHGWPMWAQVPLAVLVVDFFDYWKHRACHGLAIAWPIHALHHAVTRMHVFKAGRLHLLDSFVRNLFVYSPLVLLGAEPTVLLWIATLENFGGNLNHANLDQRLPSFVHYLFATPQVHRLHHSLDPVLGSSNLSPFTMLFDHLFGTFRHPDRHASTTVGIRDNPIPGNFALQIAAPALWPLLVRRVKRAAAA
jgi:sterol desaturase/sphingolipid hydroxylase (fatty acid hydroxylase superfamily)